MSDDGTIDREAAVAIVQALSHLRPDLEDVSPAFAYAVTKLECIHVPRLFVEATNFISARAQAYGVPDPMRATVNEPLLTRKAAALAVLWKTHAPDWSAEQRASELLTPP